MPPLNFFILSLVLFPIVLIGQRDKISGHQINITTNFNFNPISTNYVWEITGLSTNRDVDLNFVTPNSGTFELEKDTFDIINIRTMNVPDSRINLGFSIQIINDKQLYHNIQISNVSSTTATNAIDYRREHINNPLDTFKLFDDEKVDALMGTLTYEFGKYFGDINENSTVLGLGISTSMVYNKYSIKERRLHEKIDYAGPGTSGKVFNFNLGLTANYWIQINDNFALEAAYAPYLRLGSLGGVKYDSPHLPPWTENGIRLEGQVAFNYFLRIGLKFRVKDYYKGRKRKRK